MLDGDDDDRSVISSLILTPSGQDSPRNEHVNSKLVKFDVCIVKYNVHVNIRTVQLLFCATALFSSLTQCKSDAWFLKSWHCHIIIANHSFSSISLQLIFSDILEVNLKVIYLALQNQMVSLLLVKLVKNVTLLTHSSAKCKIINYTNRRLIT